MSESALFWFAVAMIVAAALYLAHMVAVYVATDREIRRRRGERDARMAEFDRSFSALKRQMRIR